MGRNVAVIGIGNMAKAIIGGVVSSNEDVSQILLYDKNPAQYAGLPTDSRISFYKASSVAEAIDKADCVLISVKPQNYEEVLAEMKNVVHHAEKLYISIGAGITADSVSESLGGACVVRVLPNVPMIIGKGVSVICENPAVSKEDFEFVCAVFRCAGSVLLIQESEMNRIIGVTSSSPAYVFQFINAIYQGALAQGLPDSKLLEAICDVVIGSAQLLKQSEDTPETWIARVASKGGTTEQALAVLRDYHFDDAMITAMRACTRRADELGSKKQ